MNRWVDISFDCIPLRSVARFDVPIDASPKYAAMILRIKAAVEAHGSFNSYYLHNAKCIFHLTNDDRVGMLDFRFEGTVFTDAEDLKPIRSLLEIGLEKEDCDWLTQPVVAWFQESVRQAVLVEFGRYIQVGDLEKTRKRMEELQKSIDTQQGFLGMYL